MCVSVEDQKRGVKYIDMDHLYSPKTPEKDWDEEMMENLTLAPRKPYNANLYLTKFLHENTEFLRDEFFLISGRIFGYIFHKPSRTVTLYTSDETNEFVHGQDPCLVFPEKDWQLFFNRIWKDLNDCGEEPLYIGEWDGATPDIRYRVIGDHAQKTPDDCVYIFSCEDKTKLSSCSGDDQQKEYHEMFTLQLLFKWCDLHLLSALFSIVNKMFKWCDMRDGYNKIKTQLFHPETSPCRSSGVLPSPPIYYNHYKEQ